ncbi:FapA family protein [Saccharibacillus alkalitolerans]|uniref:FapA family protein n=1 Tax=Saccharibacillus alkalitolerans TaxID=2705290 RepID=A0ABX0EZT8_9BACL|nr:FapA family protein [Saccharibacillus alkalitolerans]NGZ73790.1 FapA family protein [Saccharibacillus alkalitolerans]
MKRTIITRAKNPEAAVEEALHLLSVSRESVQIEILEPGGRGVLGIGARLAVVKVSVTEPEQKEEDKARTAAAVKASVSADFSSAKTYEKSDDGLGGSGLGERPTVQDMQEGEVGIQDGRFRIRAPGSRLPMLTPPLRATLYKNGARVEGKVPLAPGDELELDEEPLVEEPVWRIELDESLLRADLHVRPGFERRYKLMDCLPQPHLIVPVSETRTFLPIDAAAVRGRLKEMGVVYGIRGETIAEACASEHSGVFAVAEGTPAEEGADGKFETNFEVETKRLSPKSREDGTIDYREVVQFPTVAEGQVLVRTLPARPGRPGRDLFDRPIEPRPVQSIVLAAGEGASVTEDGRRVVALRPGMPKLKHQGFRVHVSVMPKLSHTSDVDLKSGNIRFRGDVEISGGVQNGMKVEAFGSIAIRGPVGSAVIDASYSLIASGSVIGAQVNVGKRNEFLDQIEPLLLEISVQTQLLQSAIEQLGRTAAFKLNDLKQTGLGTLLSVLLRGKFKGFHAVLMRFSEQAAKNEAQLDEEWNGYANRLRSGFLDLRQGGFRDEAELERFRRHTLELYESFCGAGDQTVFADLQYVQNSHVYCGGNVRAAKGGYNSTIYCQGALEAGGTLRGGMYFAAGGMKVKEVGAPGGAATKLQVSETSAIRAGRVMEGTVVQIGRRSFQFVEAASNVHARLDPSGELLLF